jgi:hypothetical protein
MPLIAPTSSPQSMMRNAVPFSSLTFSSLAVTKAGMIVPEAIGFAVIGVGEAAKEASIAF